MVGNAYLYGREWLSDKLHHALDGDEANKEKIEKQVIAVWDQLYQVWFTRVSTGISCTRSGLPG